MHSTGTVYTLYTKHKRSCTCTCTPVQGTCTCIYTHEESREAQLYTDRTIWMENCRESTLSYTVSSIPWLTLSGSWLGGRLWRLRWQSSQFQGVPGSTPGGAGAPSWWHASESCLAWAGWGRRDCACVWVCVHIGVSVCVGVGESGCRLAT